MDKTGSIWGWGINDENQLGRRLFGRHQNSYIPQQIRVCRGKATYIGSGQCHSFAIDQSGAVWAWGRNSNWEAGYTEPKAGEHASCLPYPVKIKQLAGVSVVSLSGGGSHSCAVTSDGCCFAWGKMSTGQLGVVFTAEQLQDEALIRRGIRDTPEICTRPTPVLGVGKVALATCGTDHTIFVNSDGKVYTSGFGFQGQLGLGSDEDAEVATQITSKSVRERKITWAGAGGGFSIITEMVNQNIGS